jgi:hypothetical protein
MKARVFRPPPWKATEDLTLTFCEIHPFNRPLFVKFAAASLKTCLDISRRGARSWKVSFGFPVQSIVYLYPTAFFRCPLNPRLSISASFRAYAGYTAN